MHEIVQMWSALMVLVLTNELHVFDCVAFAGDISEALIAIAFCADNSHIFFQHSIIGPRARRLIENRFANMLRWV